jgi:hypothetical protein
MADSGSGIWDLIGLLILCRICLPPQPPPPSQVIVYESNEQKKFNTSAAGDEHEMPMLACTTATTHGPTHALVERI